MLSEEEKQAIEYVKSLVDLFDKGFPLNYLEEENDTLKILLNLINKLKKENEVLKQAYDRETADRSNDLLELQKKDKMIDLMAEELQTHIFVVSVGKTIIGKKGIKEYYEQKATNDV